MSADHDICKTWILRLNRGKPELLRIAQAFELDSTSQHYLIPIVTQKKFLSIGGFYYEGKNRF